MTFPSVPLSCKEQKEFSYVADTTFHHFLVVIYFIWLTYFKLLNLQIFLIITNIQRTSGISQET